MSEKPRSYVYFLQAGEGGPIKIGVATNPMTRARELQTGNHEQLTLLAWSPGDQANEHALHQRFAHIRLRGEWFRADQQLLSFIAGIQWSRRCRKEPVQNPAETLYGLTRDQLEAIRYYLMLEEHNFYNRLDEPTNPQERLRWRRRTSYMIAAASFSVPNESAFGNPAWAAARFVHLAPEDEDELSGMYADAAAAAEAEAEEQEVGALLSAIPETPSERH